MLHRKNTGTVAELNLNYFVILRHESELNKEMNITHSLWAIKPFRF